MMNLLVYSKYLITKKDKQSKVRSIPMYILYFVKSFNLSEAQAITIETLDDIKTIVFTVAIGTLTQSPQSKSPGSHESGGNICREQTSE